MNDRSSKKTADDSVLNRRNDDAENRTAEDPTTEATDHARRRAQFRKVSAFLKLGLLLVLLVGIPAYVFFFHHELLDQFSSVDDVNAFFDRHRAKSVWIYLGIQIIQIIICIIPGAAIQFSAGYIFHFWLGLLLSVIGVMIGSVITYYLARVLGHDAIRIMFGEEKIQGALQKINSKKGVIIVFLIYLIPGIPKDFFTYAAGISEMKLRLFLILSMVGRLPAMMGSIIIGQQVRTGGYMSAAIIGAFAVICCVLGLLYRNRITAFFDSVYEKLQKFM